MTQEKVVLFVEDDDLKFRAISTLLRRRLPHLQVARATTATEAVAVLGAHRVDLVLTDASFPFMAGTPEILAYPTVLREAQERGLPCIVISGMNPPDDFDGTWIIFGRDCSMRELHAEVEGMLERGDQADNEPADDATDQDAHGEPEHR